MKKIIITASCILFACISLAQMEEPPGDNAITCFNNFHKFIYDHPNPDSAVYCARKVATDTTHGNLLPDLLHNQFAQQFRSQQFDSTDTAGIDKNARRLALCKEILGKMVSDTTRALQIAAKPLFLFTQIQEQSADPAALTKLVTRILNQGFLSGDIYKNREARYGLLFHQILSAHPTLEPIAKQLLTTIKAKVKQNLVRVTDSSTRLDLDKRAWYRYLYAYINYVEAKQTADFNQQAILLKSAFDYSPDLVDLNHNGYSYDMYFLTNGEKETFRDDYLNLLKKTPGNNQKVLTALLDIALISPEHKNDLKAYYNANRATQMPFNDYWNEAIDQRSKPAPPVLLQLLDNRPFSSKNLLGKWILVDFWGTWCGPCREEHPDMEKFYQSTIKKSKDISLLLVACRDSYDKVSKYMEEKKFSFPVAMSDNKIENNYKVQGYPTKILITPKGNYIQVPFGVDWVNFVKQYCNL